jgi:RNA polymerase sigma-70 factor (ECF subfamily)
MNVSGLASPAIEFVSASFEVTIANFTTACVCRDQRGWREGMNHRQLEDCVLAEQMRAAQAGDAEAYAAVLKAITPKVRQIVQKRRGFLQAADVEDLVQEVLLSVHAVRRTYDPERPFMPWLLAITQNRLADAARRHARRGAHETQVEQLPVTFSEQTANMESEVYRDPEALKQAVQQLPRGQREAIEMLKLREMSLKEAAAQSGTSVGALKVSVHRAMVALRKALTKG